MTKRRPPSVRKLPPEFAHRVGLLQLAVAVLGDARVGHVTGAYTVAQLTTGTMHLVTTRDDSPFCVSCDSSNDDHTAVIRLHRARLAPGA